LLRSRVKEIVSPMTLLRNKGLLAPT